jgi:predicted amidophosphoribosyltransferase
MRIYHRYLCLDCQRAVECDDESGCPVCGGENLEAASENPREWNDDDGVQYGDPRDYRDERLLWD